MIVRPLVRAVALVAAASAAIHCVAQSATLRLQPLTPAGRYEFVAMSRDGSTVMARTLPGTPALAITWRPATGEFSALPTGLVSRALSANGSFVLVGAEVWRLQGGFAARQYTIPSDDSLIIGTSAPIAISPDGQSTVLNPQRTIGQAPNRFSLPIVTRFNTATQGFQDFPVNLPFPLAPGSAFSVRGLGASTDLNRALLAVRIVFPCIACAGNQPDALPENSPALMAVSDLNGETHLLEAGTPVALSGDGRVAAGSATRVGTLGRSVPALWRTPEANPTTLLPNPVPATRIALPVRALGGGFTAVNTNGEVAVGAFSAAAPRPVRPLVWIKSRGSRDLVDVLAKFNVSVPAGTTLAGARAVSDNGRTISGLAFDRDNTPLLYHITLPASEVCYANCDGSTGANPLNAADVACFTSRLAQRQFYADCNSDGQYNADDLACFMTRYNAGCGN